jgi:hypothetical protein
MGEYLSPSQVKQWEIMQMIRNAETGFRKRADDYRKMGEAGINKPSCSRVSRAYKNCADELELILSVVETVH